MTTSEFCPHCGADTTQASDESSARRILAQRATEDGPNNLQIAEYFGAATTAADAAEKARDVRRAEYLRGSADACAWVLGIFRNPPRIHR
jgi:hypothetical protein